MRIRVPQSPRERWAARAFAGFVAIACVVVAAFLIANPPEREERAPPAITIEVPPSPSPGPFPDDPAGNGGEDRP